MSRITSSTVRACQRRLNDLLSSSGALELPVNLRAIAANLGVRTLEPANINIDGYVGVARDGSTVIRYRHDNSPERNRFTIAHEIGHLLVAEATGVPIAAQKMRVGFDSEEGVANQLAAEMLMPEKVMKEQLIRKGPSWGTIQEMRRLFDVSAFSMLRRITEIPGIAAVFSTFEIVDGSVSRQGFCGATRNPRLSFSSPFLNLVRTAFHQKQVCRFNAQASIADDCISLPCELRVTNSRIVLNGWAYGWKPL